MNRNFRIVYFLLALVLTLSLFTACNFGPDPVEEGKTMVTVQWVQGQRVLKEEVVEKGTILTPWTPEEEGMEFQGWYERPYIKRFDFEKPITKSMRIYASFKSASGEEGDGDEDFVMPDWYLIGAGKGDLGKCNNWNHEAAAKNLPMVAGEDGIYKITLELYAGDQFKMTNNLDWTNEVNIQGMEGFTLDAGSTSSGTVKNSAGEVVFKGAEGDYWNFTVAEGMDGKYDIYYDPATQKMSFALVEKLDGIPDDIRLIGDFNGWSTVYDGDAFRFTSDDGIVWTYVWEVTSPATFKLYNNISGVYYPGGVDNDLSIQAGTYTLTYNLQTGSLTVVDANGQNVDVGYSGGNSGGGTTGPTVTPNTNPVEKVYVVLNSAWNDGSIMGAWTWGGGIVDQWVDFAPTEEPNVFEVTLPTGANMIIFVDFNAGVTEYNWDMKREQTTDLAVPDKSDDKIYYHVGTGTWSADSTAPEVDPGETPTPGGDGITVYFLNNWKWTSVSAYYWGTSADPSWPGNAMTLVGELDGYEVYSIVIPNGVTGLIFNGNKDDGSGMDQTPDIVSGIAHGKAWKMEWNNGNKAVEFIYNPGGCSHSSTAEGVVVTAPTCTQSGEMSYVCDKCAETYTVSAPATGHDYGADGVCKNCGQGTVYTVVGQAGLCGSDWNTGDTANDMVFDEATGTYTKVYTGIAAGTYEYKVCRDHKWGAGEYPTNAGNMTLDVATDNSTVTITWDPIKQELKAEVTAG